MHIVHIGSASDYLRLTAHADHNADEVSADLHVGGLSASRQVVQYPSGFQDLAGFFADLEERWRGWDGPTVWESLEGDLKCI